MLIAGGCVNDGCGDATDETFILSLNLSFANGPAMSRPRDSHTATPVSNGDVVLAGGFSGEGQGALSSVDVYRSASGTIKALNGLATARGGHAAAGLPDGRVLIVAGWIASHTYTASTAIVDPRTGTNTPAADLPWAADAIDAVALADGRILVTGGQVQPGIATNEAAIYDPQTGTWQNVGPMNTARLKHTTVLLGDGRVLVMGGSSDDQNILNTTELFDPATDKFTPGPDLLEPRYKMPGGAVLVGDEQVLIAGGGRSVELLDVAAGVSTAIETFATRGAFATITPLGPDDWLVLGGYDDAIRLRRIAEVINRSQL